MFRISIIVPCYNHAIFLRQRMDSILNQSFQDFELILLDDASTDSSWEILQMYQTHEKVSYCLLNETNSGSPFKQWKKGIDLAKFDWIWIAESDDFSDLYFLEEMSKFIRAHNLDIAYCQSYDIDEKDNIILDRIEWTRDFNPNIWIDDWVLNGNEFIEKYLQVKSVIPNASGCIFNKNLINPRHWEKLTKMKICGDWLFWLSISKGANIGFRSMHLNFFRYHQSVTRNHSSLDKRITRIYEEFIVLKFLESEYGIVSSNIKLVHRKWFALYGVFDPYVNRRFFEANMFKSKLSLLLSFKMFRIRSYLKKRFLSNK